MDGKLKGVRGWLLIYVLFGFLSSFQLILMGFLMFNSGVYSDFLSGGSLIFGAIWIYTLIQIITKKKKAKDMTIYLLGVGIIIAIAGEINWIVSLGLSSLWKEIQFLIGTGVYIVIIFYFKNSERVKNTLIKK